MIAFKLEVPDDVPAAYVEIGEEGADRASTRQEVVDISEIGFTPRELIFDVNADDRVIGVEIL